MDISLLKNVNKVCVHANCPDGTSSGMILRDALNLKPEQIVFVQHDTLEYKEMKAEPGLMFCDCTPPPDRVQEFVKAGTIVLDHHKYARDIVAAFGENGVFADKEKEPEVSGARLAYRVWKLCGSSSFNRWVDDGPPEWQSKSFKKIMNDWVDNFSHIAGIRDNWQINSPLWKESCEQAAILMFFPRDSLISDPLSSIASSWDMEYGRLGSILVNKDLERAEHIAEKRWIYRTDSGLIIAIVPSRLISDASDLLEDECEVVIGFSYTKNEPGCYPGLLLSLRSFGDSFDCGKFCKAHGGGGHANAAGCKFDTEATTLNPYKLICDKFDEYLSKG